MLTKEGREKSIIELTEISEYLSKLDARMILIYKKVFNKLGLTEEDVKKHLDVVVANSLTH